MPHQDQIYRSNDEEAPLLSDDARRFVDGNIDADEYIRVVKREEAESTKRYFDPGVRQQRLFRLNLLVVLILAAIAYLVVGLISLGSKGYEGFSPVALGTSAAAVIGIVFTRLVGVHNRDRD